MAPPMFSQIVAKLLKKLPIWTKILSVSRSKEHLPRQRAGQNHCGGDHDAEHEKDCASDEAFGPLCLEEGPRALKDIAKVQRGRHDLALRLIWSKGRERLRRLIRIARVTESVPTEAVGCWNWHDGLAFGALGLLAGRIVVGSQQPAALRAAEFNGHDIPPFPLPTYGRFRTNANTVAAAPTESQNQLRRAKSPGSRRPPRKTRNSDSAT